MKAKNTNSELNWDIATKVLSGEANTKEKQIIEDWCNYSDENKNEWNKIYKGLVESDKALIASKVDTEEAFYKVKKQIKNKRIRKISVFTYSSVAAAILLLIGIFSLYNTTNTSSPIIVKTSNNIETNYVLADGSIIDINKNSVIQIPESFNAGTRSISLKGEAFFDVKRDTSSPFIISINDIKVKVLGTSFNIKESNKKTEITVNSGTVIVYKSEKEDNYIELNKNEKALYNKNQKSFAKSISNNLNYLAWKTKKLRFKEEPLHLAISTIEDIYNVEIIFPDEFDISSAQLSATFNKNNIDFIIDVLSKTYNIEISYIHI